MSPHTHTTKKMMALPRIIVNQIVNFGNAVATALAWCCVHSDSTTQRNETASLSIRRKYFLQEHSPTKGQQQQPVPSKMRSLSPKERLKISNLVHCTKDPSPSETPKFSPWNFDTGNIEYEVTWQFVPYREHVDITPYFMVSFVSGTFTSFAECYEDAINSLDMLDRGCVKFVIKCTVVHRKNSCVLRIKHENTKYTVPLPIDNARTYMSCQTFLVQFLKRCTSFNNNRMLQAHTEHE